MTEICKALMGMSAFSSSTSRPRADHRRGADSLRCNQDVTDRGVGVIYVTHRLNEVFRISQRVTVFRDGSNVAHSSPPKPT